MKIIFLIFLSLKAFSSDNLKEILRKADNVYRSKSSESSMEMKITTPHWERILVLKSWTKGVDNTFITILSPRKEKGVSTLKKENEMWNYFPKVNKVIKVPPSMMMGSWMGSDFTNDDLVKENTYIDDYNYKLLEKKNNIYTIELIPKKETVTIWGKLILTVDIDKFIPITQNFYDEKGVLKRILTFTNVEKIGKVFVPKTMILETLNKPGHKTEINYSELNLDANVDDSIFSLKNLQKRR